MTNTYTRFHSQQINSDLSLLSIYLYSPPCRHVSWNLENISDLAITNQDVIFFIYLIILSNFILFEGIFIQQINKRSVSTSIKIVGASRKVREDYAKKATIDDADSSVQSANFVPADFLISGHPANPRLMEAALSLVHGHQVNIDIAYEFSILQTQHSDCHAHPSAYLKDGLQECVSLPQLFESGESQMI